ncbi:hypothetical protein Tco_1447228 [Tanacetum coccineum]
MDSIIPIGQKNTLAEYMILSSADNRLLMLDKDLYVSWKSRMELYMQNRENGRMILELVQHGPLIWPTIQENGVTMTKKYAELYATEKIQADCDLKATNIILQVLPSDIYSLVNHHRVAKDLWEKVQLLMQGTSLTKHERECKLYDAFDKFTHIKGGSLHQYYLRFTQLINDMNIYKIKMEQFQVNTKFLTSLPPKWSKFVTDVKLVKDLHTTNFDQLHAYLEQHELHANEVHLMRECRYDPIDAINKMMSFLSTIVTSRFPSTKNQLRNSSNPRQQATIHDGRVTVQPLQWGRPKLLMLLCLKDKRIGMPNGLGKSSIALKLKENGLKFLNEEELEFLGDPGIKRSVTEFGHHTHATYQAEMDLDAYDSDWTTISKPKQFLWHNLSVYGIRCSLGVINLWTTLNNDMLNQSVQEMPYSEPSHFLEHPENEIHSDSNIIPHS